MIHIIRSTTWRMNQQQLADQQAEILRLRKALADIERIAAGRLAALSEAHEQVAVISAERAEAASIIVALTQRLAIANMRPGREPNERPYWSVRLADGTIAGPFSRS